MRSLPPHTSLSRSRSRRPLILALCFPILLFLFARHYAKTHYFRDPTSLFFDPSRGYDAKYSTIRKAEAEEFVELSSQQRFLREEGERPLVCLSMLTIARPSGDVYFRDSLGSLLAGLSQAERNQIYILPFIGHTNASSHPVYLEPWLWNVADKVLTYNNSEVIKQGQWEHIRELEVERERSGIPDREKHLFDYTLALRECELAGASYTAVFEDDVLALDGWFGRMRAALEKVERIERRRGGNGSNFFYLRLFYTEGELGWNTEEWPMYIGWTSLALTIIIGIQAVTFYIFRRTAMFRNHGREIVFGCLLSVCLMTVWFYLAGRVSVLPLRTGVHEMQKYGCCAQAIVYPREKVEMLANYYTTSRIGFVDTLAERLADEKPEETGVRWAITPSVVQHIGGRSSKGDAQWDGVVNYVDGKTQGARLWNFAFELNEKDQLRREHLEQIEGEAVRGGFRYTSNGET